MKKFTRILSLTLVSVFLLMIFVACGTKPSSNAKTAFEKLKKNKYDVSLSFEQDEYTDEDYPIEYAVFASKGSTSKDNYEFVRIAYFKDKKTAQKYWDKNEDDISSVSKETQETYGSKYIAGIDGKMIYAGTTNAVKAAK